MLRRMCAMGAIAALVVTGAGWTQTTSSVHAASVAKTPHKALTIGFMIDQAGYYYQTIQHTLEKLAAKDGGKVLTVNTNDDASTESQEVQTFITRKVDAIIMSPVSNTSSLVTVKAARAAGIPVICYNTCLSDTDSRTYTSAYIESNNRDLGVESGKFAANYIRTKLHGKAKLALLNCDQFPICRLRKAGFKAALKGLNVQYVADQSAYAPDTAATATQDILTAHPDINAIWSVNDGGLEGAYATLKARPSSHKIVIFGTDIDPTIAQYLLNKNGIVQCTTGQDGPATARAAYSAVQKAVAHQTIKPFIQQIPGAFFSHNNPKAIRKFIAKNA